MAIAFDAYSTGGQLASFEDTWSHTCSGSNLILIVEAISTNPAATTRAYQHNGTSYVEMTLISEVTQSGTARKTSIFYLLNPATGARNIKVDASVGPVDVGGCAVSYTGVKQSGQPDASDTYATTTTDSPSKSLTTVADNCWVVFAGDGASLNQFTAGANTTLRVNDYVNNGQFICDNNAAKTPAGSVTLAMTCSSQKVAGVILSIKPASAGGSRPHTFGLLGVGS